MASIKSYVVSEAKAVARRVKLEDVIKGRPDIIGTRKLSTAMRKTIIFSLVPGVDYPSCGGPGELPAGGRYVKLCFSNALAASAALGICTYQLPVSKADLKAYYETTLGLDANGWQELHALFGIDYALIDDVRSHLTEHPDPTAWQLLLSHEFELAVAQSAMLSQLPKSLSWRKPVVDAFKVLAELERLVLLAKRLARIDKAVDTSLLLSILEGAKPLSYAAGAERDEVYAFLERLLIADIAIETYLTSPAELKKALPADFPLKKIECGSFTDYDDSIWTCNGFVPVTDLIMPPLLRTPAG